MDVVRVREVQLPKDNGEGKKKRSKWKNKQGNVTSRGPRKNKLLDLKEIKGMGLLS